MALGHSALGQHSNVPGSHVKCPKTPGQDAIEWLSYWPSQAHWTITAAMQASVHHSRTQSLTFRCVLFPAMTSAPATVTCACAAIVFNMRTTTFQRSRHVPLGAAKVRTLCSLGHAGRLIAASASRTGRWWRACCSPGARRRSLQQATPGRSTTGAARWCAPWDQTCTAAPQSWLLLLQNDLLPRTQVAH